MLVQLLHLQGVVAACNLPLVASRHFLRLGAIEAIFEKIPLEFPENNSTTTTSQANLERAGGHTEDALEMSCFFCHQ